MDYWLHWYLCEPSGAKGLATARHNATCRALERAVAKGTLGHFLKYTNFGRTDEEPEERTVPEWMLHGTRVGLPDKPDFLIVKGMPKERAPPLAPPHEASGEGPDYRTHPSGT